MGNFSEAHDIESLSKALKKDRALGSSGWHCAGLARGRRG